MYRFQNINKSIQRFTFLVCSLGLLTVGTVPQSAGAQASDAKVVPRLAPKTVLERASKAWETINDYQGALHQVERQPNGTLIERWATVTLIKVGQGPENPPVFRVDFFDRPIEPQAKAASQVKQGTPSIIYFSDDSRRLFTYKPKENHLVISWLDESGPLPEFLYIAGFIDFNLDQFYERAYLDADTWSETINGRKTYRVKAIPRSKVRTVEPERVIWIDQETNLPVRFAVEGDVSVVVDIFSSKINQTLLSGDLIPEVPGNVYFVDQTQ